MLNVSFVIRDPKRTFVGDLNQDGTTEIAWHKPTAKQTGR
jgi:hypothetical protein